MVSANPGLRRTGIGVALGLGLLALAHLGALDNSFHYDDLHSVVDNPHVQQGLQEPARLLLDPSTFSERPERAVFV